MNADLYLQPQGVDDSLLSEQAKLARMPKPAYMPMLAYMPRTSLLVRYYGVSGVMPTSPIGLAGVRYSSNFKSYD